MLKAYTKDSAVKRALETLAALDFELRAGNERGYKQVPDVEALNQSKYQVDHKGRPLVQVMTIKKTNLRLA